MGVFAINLTRYTVASENYWRITSRAFQWRHNERDGVSKHRRHDCLLNRLFKRRSKKTSKLRVTELSEGNQLVTGGLPLQSASNAENVSIWWRHHVTEKNHYSWQVIDYFISYTHLLDVKHGKTATDPSFRHYWLRWVSWLRYCDVTQKSIVTFLERL